MKRLISWVEVEHAEHEDFITFYSIEKDGDHFLVYKMQPISTDTLEYFHKSEDWFVGNHLIHEFGGAGIELKYKHGIKSIGDCIHFENSYDFYNKQVENIYNEMNKIKHDLYKISEMYDKNLFKDIVKSKEEKLNELSKELKEKLNMHTKMIKIGI